MSNFVKGRGPAGDPGEEDCPEHTGRPGTYRFPGGDERTSPSTKVRQENQAER
jgi:hypothetical protein